MGVSEETEEEIEKGYSTLQLICILVLVVSIFFTYAYQKFPRFHKIEKYFPHSSANLFVGIIVGAVLSQSILSEAFSFKSYYFFIYMLPPIIFEAGYNIPKVYFLHNLGTILVFALVGTLFSAFTIGSLLHLACITTPSSFPTMSWNYSMVIASLLSATDPVAVILAVRLLNVDEQLKILLIGESTLNDVSAIVINRVFVQTITENNEGGSVSKQLFIAFGKIVGVGIASILLGCIIAFALSYLYKKAKLNQYKEIEFPLFLIAAFFPYVISNVIGLSGIMALVFSGVVMDYYTSYHFSPDTEISAREFVTALAYLVDGFVFIYLGLSFFISEGKVIYANYITVTILLCLLGRMVGIFPLGYLLNKVRKHHIPFKHQLVLWFAGLRGPCAYALAVSIPSGTTSNELNSHIIITTTIFVVAFTTFFMGGLSYPFISYINAEKVSRRYKLTEFSHHWFDRLDRAYLKPWFGPTGERHRHRFDAIELLQGQNGQSDGTSAIPVTQPNVSATNDALPALLSRSSHNMGHARVPSQNINNANLEIIHDDPQSIPKNMTSGFELISLPPESDKDNNNNTNTDADTNFIDVNDDDNNSHNNNNNNNNSNGFDDKFGQDFNTTTNTNNKQNVTSDYSDLNNEPNTN